MAFESIDVSGPELAEGSEPVVDLLKGFGSEPVETALSVHGGLHETGAAQHPQMLGDGGLRHTKLTLDFTHRLLGGDEEAEDGAAVGFGDDFEDRFHPLDIPQRVYACQGI